MKILTNIAMAILIILVLMTGVFYLFPIITHTILDDGIPDLPEIAYVDTSEETEGAEESPEPDDTSAYVPSYEVQTVSFVNEGGGELPPFPFEEILSGLDDDCEQAVVVLADFSAGNLWCVEKREGLWYTAAGPLYCRVGKNGVTDEKTEGDGKTPLGITVIGNVYLNTRITVKMPVTVLKNNDVWVTDPESPLYNTLATRDGTEEFKSSMPMPGGDLAAYIDIGYNPDCVPELGSAVLLRASSQLSIGTDGEIALSLSDMERALAWLDSGSNPVFAVYAAADLGWTTAGMMDGSFEYADEKLVYAKEDIKFAKNDNPLGRPLDGFMSSRAVLSRELAEALLNIEQELQKKDIGLIIYSAYMPKRAVTDFINWASEPDDPDLKAEYYPVMDKKRMPDLYGDCFDQHSLGTAIDVGLYRISSGVVLDLGPFYSFTGLDNFHNDALSYGQRENRKFLRAWMEWGGFEADDSKWWHFNLITNAPRNTKYNFMVVQ